MSKVIRFPKLNDLPEGKVVIKRRHGSIRISYSFGDAYNRKYDWLVKDAIGIAEGKIWKALEATRAELFSRIIGLGI